MKQIIFGLSLALVLSGVSTAQKTVNTKASATADQTATVGHAIASGTHVSGQLQNSLDVKKAKVGDQVLLKTTKSVKQDGQVVVSKGSTLVGHVTQVQRAAKGSAGSSIGVVFDSLVQGGNRMPITAMITSVVQANTAASFSDDDIGVMSSSSAQTSTHTSTSGGNNGGLLGGAGNTVGNVVNTTTNTVGGVTNTVGQTAASTTGAVAGSVRGLTITQSTNASAQGGSTLSTSSGNLRLNQGVTFNLDVSSSTTVGKN